MPDNTTGFQAPTSPRIYAVSAEEAHELADALVTAAYAGDVQRISALFDLETTVRRALAEGHSRASLDPAFVRAATAAVRRRFEAVGLAHSLAQVAQDRSELRLLRESYAGEGRWLALRRSGTKGLEHVDCLLSLDREGRPTVVDTRLLSNGDLMSEELRDYGLPIALGEVSDFKFDFTRELTPDQAASVARHAPHIRGAQEAGAMGRYKDALRLWENLPEEVRWLRYPLLFEFDLALQAGDTQRYHEVFAKLEARYSEHPAVAARRLDYSLATENHEQALGAVDEVARHAITDPYFDVLRSNIHTDMHDPSAAKEAALRALHTAPDLKDAYWNLVAVSLNERDYAATAELLLEMRQKFNLEYSLEKAPVFAEFVASPQYQRFLRGLRGSKAHEQPVQGTRTKPRRRVRQPKGLPYADVVRRLARARAEGRSRAEDRDGEGEPRRAGSKDLEERVEYQVANTVMNIALGSE